MATYRQFNNTIPGLVAGADLSSSQYKPVRISADTAGKVYAAVSAAKEVVGILQNDPTAGQPALIAGPGDICKAVAGANDIAVGELLVPNSTGLVDATAGFTIAQALEGSSAVGDYIRVQVIRAEQAA